MGDRFSHNAGQNTQSAGQNIETSWGCATCSGIANDGEGCHSGSNSHDQEGQGVAQRKVQAGSPIHCGIELHKVLPGYTVRCRRDSISQARLPIYRFCPLHGPHRIGSKNCPIACVKLCRGTHARDQEDVETVSSRRTAWLRRQGRSLSGR
jgi:hypothetical protein